MNSASVPLITQDDALFLDFDGTLAPLQDDPDAVVLAQGMDEILLACADKLNGALALISGRDLTDLSKRTPLDLWRFGNHGLRQAGPGQMPQPSDLSAPGGLKAALRDAIAGKDGVRIEDKGAVLAIHYRQAPEAETWLAETLQKTVADFEGYKLQLGKCVMEAKPLAANKGYCLTEAIKHAPFNGRRVVMFGDDTTDEDAFIAAQVAGGVAVKVGNGDTVADYRLPNVESVHQQLREFVGV